MQNCFLFVNAKIIYRNRSRPCLQYQIGRCLAPCVKGYVSDEEYAQQVNYVRLFLSGDTQVDDGLVKRMEEASQNYVLRLLASEIKSSSKASD